MTPAIRIVGLGKRYRVDRALPKDLSSNYRTLREDLTRFVSTQINRLGRATPTRRDDFWAIQEIDLVVEEGEVMGIVGSNGAGKSTLLKILARIIRPTLGRVELRGRVGSLLEVGTGFHPELTGRENVYLNGSILGMSRAEIRRGFDEIVEFAGVEDFLDVPVKRYSSGMQVRLAFAVAAHLTPEILLIDEVLAVGDADFQRKCMGKMGSVARSGRTVLFVSHNMAAVQNLCTRAILLRNGKAEPPGPTTEVVAAYLKSVDGNAKTNTDLSARRAPGWLEVIRAVEILGPDDQPTHRVPAGSSLTIRLHYHSPVPLHLPRFGIFVETILGERLFGLQTLLQHGSVEKLPRCGVVECHVPELPLAPGTYYLSLGCSMPQRRLDFLERAIAITIERADFFGTGNLPLPEHGAMLVRANWTFRS
ncbi:ABC transporter ATP-binding protein [Paludisphaera rhizosphaerae]|uniref:ABC transporter ATP-binding protein n=1 Tax=Paludisphaera rhizosphaerae TaxID=2711216 RepID=UPI0013EABF9C|nr:ABC transporter ATP-binding protein [Paludisphaera rhizosphaerae]